MVLASCGDRAAVGPPGPLQIVTPLTFSKTGYPRIEYVCPLDDAKLAIEVVNEFGGSVMDIPDSAFIRVGASRCQSRPIGAAIMPVPQPGPCGQFTCYPNPYKPLRVGNYFLRLQAKNSAGAIVRDSGRRSVQIRHLALDRFQSGIANWKPIRGRWMQGIGGYEATGAPSAKPFYSYFNGPLDSPGVLQLGTTHSFEADINLNCFESDCAGGLAPAIWLTGSSAGIDRYSALQVVLTGDQRLLVRVMRETTSGLQEQHLLNPIDVSSLLQGNGPAKLRIEYRGPTPTEFIAIYLNGRRLTCSRIATGAPPASHTGLTFRADDSANSLEIVRFAISHSEWDNNACQFPPEP